MAADLEAAIAIAVTAHKGQKDKAGAPYVLHPLRVMLRVEGEAARMTAVLHDVVEDTGITLTDLRWMGFPDEVIDAVAALTKVEGEDLERYLERVMANPLATRVKIADLEDNMDITRIATLSDRDLARLRKYRDTWGRLKGRLDI